MDDTEILRMFVETEDPVLLTGEVTNKIGLSNQATLPRPHDLVDRDPSDSTDGGRSAVWWITEEGREVLVGTEPATLEAGEDFDPTLGTPSRQQGGRGFRAPRVSTLLAPTIIFIGINVVDRFRQ